VNRLGVVTGLTAEAHCLRRAGAGNAMAIVCSSGDSSRAESGARRLVEDGASALLSFGIAGGLDPESAAGDLIIGESVVGVGRESDHDWRNAISGLLNHMRPRVGTIVGCDRPVASVAEKAALYERHGAIAVDMESHVVGRVATETGVPFAVIRVVADSANDSLPQSALAGLGGADGAPRIGAVLGSLMLRPWELPALIRAARDARKALNVLERCARTGAPLFGRG
jgi:hopanoid-associated phosphorylase